MRKVLIGVVLGLGVAAASIPVIAHHAFGAEFDPNAPLRLKGRVVKVEWINPHAWIHIEVDECSGIVTKCVDAAGKKQVWAVEGGTPNTLLRRGLDRASIPTGTVLVVDGYRTKDPTLTRANGRDVTLESGQKFFMGSSGTGAPRDGRDATEPPPGR